MANRREMIRCCQNKTSFGFRMSSHPSVSTDGSAMKIMTANVHRIGASEMAQPKISSKSMERDTRLRRRLSNIFQRDNAEIGFLINFFSGPGTYGSNQLAICQSPLIHRRRLLT